MGKDLKEVGPVAHVAQVEYHGEKLILPQGMAIDDAIELLHRRQEFLTEQVGMQRVYNVFPWDGAYALDLVLTEKYGWSPAAPGDFFSPPPQIVSIDVGYNQKKNVTWGQFNIPGVDGVIGCGVNRSGARWQFQLSASVLRKDEATINEIFERVEKKLQTHSIYRGKAIKMRFRDAQGKPLTMPEPKFMDTESIRPEMLVYSRELQRSIQTNLFTPIQRVADCLLNGLPVKRGVLLGGKFGTGKTLAALVASKFAVEAGNTFIYAPRADELPDAIAFAIQYQNPAAVIFCEDVDRTAAGERTVSMDDLLNIIDGIDTKRANIITVLTTNDMTAINPAMIRPGRLDAVIEVAAPDAEAVQRLIRLYGGSAIPAGADLSRAGKALEGQIPAIIAEAVKRAKLAQLAYQEPGTRITELHEEAICDAAESLALQLQLLNRKEEEPAATLDSVMQDVLRPMLDDAKRSADEARDAAQKILATIS